MNSGALLAIVARGIEENEYIKRNKIFNIEEYDYQRVYTQLKYNINKEIINNEYIYTFTIFKGCDYLNNVDLYVNLEDFNVTDITQIETYSGFVKLDTINGDIETIINTTSDILKSSRKVKYLNSKIIVPLHLAPFFNNNVISPLIIDHDIKIVIFSKKELSLDIFGECYFIQDYNIRLNLLGNITSHITYQH